jgi:hypothetical protein
MSSLKTIERQPFEDLLGMSGGYVLDFTDATFASFFAESVKRNIHDDRYTKYGTSKAKKLRAFWDIEPDSVVAKVLGELIDIWAYQCPEPDAKDAAKAKRCLEIVRKLNGDKQATVVTEKDFLRQDFTNADIDKVPIEASLIPILQARFAEAGRSLRADAPLASIFMCGSVLEGMLLGIVLANPGQFSQATSCPKDSKTGKAKPFPEWKLAEMIDVACDLGFLTIDVKKFSHALRDFRNYIHPYQQMSSQFSPDKHTAEICMQVLRAVIACLSGGRKTWPRE